MVFHKDMMALTKQGAAQGSGTHLGTHPRLCPMALSWPTKDPVHPPPQTRTQHIRPLRPMLGVWLPFPVNE